MEEKDIKKLLSSVQEGSISIDEAVLKLKEAPFEDMGFARPDYHRALRQGKPEVIYGEGKTPDQILSIAENFLSHGQGRVLITRMSKDKVDFYAQNKTEISRGFVYDEMSRIGIALGKDFTGEKLFSGSDTYLSYGEYKEIFKESLSELKGKIVIATGGTSDIPVAEEAAITAEFYGNKVVRLYDIGVAGIHRLFNKEAMDEIMTAKTIVAIAGMEGALASVIGGIADCPVIAVPTSVGYGASFGGISALLSMLNSCASGVSVVNIDNGFGAGFLASMINRN